MTFQCSYDILTLEKNSEPNKEVTMAKEELCKDQREGLVAMLTTFFKGLEAEVIDDVVAEAKKQATAETVEERKNGLAKLFDSQMETLKQRGCPQVILEMFRDKKSEVLDKAVEMGIPEGNIPFVPVIPRSYMGIYGLMPMVRNGEKVGYTHLDPNEITDDEECPKAPYYIYDVEPGETTLGKSPKDGERIIQGQNRLCHVPEEDIAVCVHTDVLSDHCLWSAGSCYGHTDKVPRLRRDSYGPMLGWGYANELGERRGSASCRSRA